MWPPRSCHRPSSGRGRAAPVERVAASSRIEGRGRGKGKRAERGGSGTEQCGDEGDQASRPISTARLKRSRALHLPPIYAVVSCGPSGTLRCGRSHLGVGFPLRMLSAVIPSRPGYPAMPRAGQQVHQRSVHSGPLVLGAAPLKSPAPTADTDRTVSRRSKPSSCTALTGEQPDPWDLLQPQDAISRHRGAKPPRQCELSGVISLLSPAYLLSDERRPFHAEPPDH